VERDQLKKYRIGLVKGYNYGEPHDSLFAKLHKGDSGKILFVEGKDTTLQLFGLLKEKKVDLIIEDERVVQYLAALPNKPLQNQKFHNIRCFNKLPIYVAFSPARTDSVRLAKIFDKGILSLQEGKKLKKIRAKYSVNDF
jgi:polar amino acid transport system substrate-binding protein